MQRKGMDTTGQLIGQHFIHRPVPGKQPLTTELLGNQHDLEMRFGSRRNIVTRAFIQNLEMLQFKTLVKLFENDGFDTQMRQPIAEMIGNYRPSRPR